jgi:hypothetical protein
LISRKRLHRANQIAERTYKIYHVWDWQPEYHHDVWGGHRARKVDPRLFGMYRKTRVFREHYICDCYYCVGSHKSRQLWRSDISFREQLREEGVI